MHRQEVNGVNLSSKHWNLQTKGSWPEEPGEACPPLLGIGLITVTKLWLALVSFWERRKEVVVDLTEAVHGAEACFSELPAKH